MSAPETREDRPEELKKRSGFLASLLYAANGLARTLCSQRNMKIHWISGLAVMLVGMALELNIAARASVIFCVFVVLCMEVLNTALESFVDLHVRQYARHAMIAKDGAAAAVLVLAFGAVIVFADVLFHNWQVVQASGPAIRRTVLLGVPLLVVLGLLLFVRRRLGLLLGLFPLAMALLGTLAYYSRDEVFTVCGSFFVVFATYARWREPALFAPADLPARAR